MNEIKDGTGSCNFAKVDSNKRLHVDSIDRTQDQLAAMLGNSYNINTGAITLTNDGNSALFYLKYTGDETLIIKEILGIIGSSTGGTGDATMNIIKNPTTGTVISNAVSVDVKQNRDFSSPKELDALVYKGAVSNTITNGSTFASTNRSSFATPIEFDASIIVLRKGNSIAVTFTPPSGNTSQVVRIAVTAFEDVSEL